MAVPVAVWVSVWVKVSVTVTVRVRVSTYEFVLVEVDVAVRVPVELDVDVPVPLVVWETVPVPVTVPLLVPEPVLVVVMVPLVLAVWVPVPVAVPVAVALDVPLATRDTNPLHQYAAAHDFQLLTPRQARRRAAGIIVWPACDPSNCWKVPVVLAKACTNSVETSNEIWHTCAALAAACNLSPVAFAAQHESPGGSLPS